MDDFNRDLERLKLSYQTGKIDEETYRAELRKFTDNDLSEDGIEQKNTKIKKEKMFKILEFLKSFWLQIIIIILLIMIVCKVTAFKEYELVVSFDSLPEPMQSDLLGGKIETNFLTKKFDIIYGAEYTIYGRVVGTRTFMPFNARDSISPMDIALSWGFAAQDRYDQRVIYTSLISRFLKYWVEDVSYFKDVGGMKGLGNHISNNHVIPADSKVRTLFKKIKVDDFIKLEGFLVTVQDPTTGEKILNSSSVRYDSGGGACEVMYVTDVKWLKEDS